MRIPASFCGVLGFRPSHAAVCSSGMLPNSQSLDAIGIALFATLLSSFHVNAVHPF